MKKLIIICAAVLFFACNNEKKEESKVTYSDLTADQLKGDISSIEETPYQVDSTGAIGAMDSCCIDVTEYDENGNAVKAISKDSKGTIKSEMTMTRYDNGLFKSQTGTRDGKPSGSFETIIDEKGMFSGGKAYDTAGKLEFYYTDLAQNAEGEVIHWKQWDKDSVFRMEGENAYDKHLQTASSAKDSVGVVKNSSTYKYNDKGERIEVVNTNVGKDSTTTKVTKYTYDAQDDMGNWTQRTTLNEKGIPTKIVKRVYTYRKEEEKK